MYKIILLFCCSITVSYGQINPQDIEIVRDSYGVPHIYGKTDADTSGSGLTTKSKVTIV